ncbi:peptidase M20 [Hyphomonas sp. WL0036]|uniref:M20 family metallopeptidase n=1 Tax=Hyphomonas sediminis TaxID=2866160 RepID=UPI001C803D01|nr:peptidase M20 [Hyphomonas sediminis]MBY9067225.1 peptidase M20 [Hyphomonas sediminis]
MADGLLETAIGAGISPEDVKAISDAIDIEELTKLVLDLSNIYSPSTGEAEASAFVHEWMSREGFRPLSVGAVPHRQNVIGSFGGHGPGKNLLFTAHLDTESEPADPVVREKTKRPSGTVNREWKECWLEDGKFYGYAVANDRGPMSCMLMAAKALKKAGYELSGRMYLTACPGECGPEPIEERGGIDYMGKEIGAHYMFHHGGVAPDFAIAAEGTDFGVTWLGCGGAMFRIRIYGESIFRPLLKAPRATADHPSPIYKLGPVIEALHAWSLDYEKLNAYHAKGGSSLPKATISSVQAGFPYSGGTEVAAIYVSCDLSPKQKAAQVLHELEAVMRSLPGLEFEVEPVNVSHGYEADDEEVAPLVTGIDIAVQSVLDTPVEIAKPVYSSMWRDHNVFNMHRVPAVTFGPVRWRPTPEDFFKCTLMYALTALAVCGRAEGDVKALAGKTVYGDNPFD